MSLVLKILVPIGILVLAGFVTVYLVASRTAPPQVQIEPPALLVEVAEAQAEAIRYTVQSQGTVSPQIQTVFRSEVRGVIVDTSTEFVNGGFFAKDEILVQVDPRNYQSALKRAEADVAAAATQVARERAQARHAIQDYERLRRNQPNVAPPTSLALRVPQLEEARSRLASAEAALLQARDDLDRTAIRAPYAGMIIEKRTELGQLLSTGADVAVAISTDVAEVRLPLTPLDLKYMEFPTSDPATHSDVILTAEIAGAEKRWHGKIVRSEGVVDAKSRVIYVVAQIQDPYDRANNGLNPLRIGSYVQAEVVGTDAGEVFKVPRHALKNNDTLWLVDTENKIYPQQLEIERSDDRFAYIRSGLTNGDRYCVTPIERPLPGMSVRYSG